MKIEMGLLEDASEFDGMPRQNGLYQAVQALEISGGHAN